MELQTTCAHLRETVGAMAAEDVCFGLGLPSSNLPDGLIIEYVGRWLQRWIIIRVEGPSANYDTIIREDHGVAATHLGGSATTAVRQAGFGG